MAQNSLTTTGPTGGALDIAGRLDPILEAWAEATTGKGPRFDDLVRDKKNVVRDFFGFVGKRPGQVRPDDVKNWQAKLEGQLNKRGKHYEAGTIYGMISRVSSFYAWAMKNDPRIAEAVGNNPANLARPKAPKAYQNESAQALSNEDMSALLAVVKARAKSGDVVGKRDYALLLFYVLTGMRRSEIIRLKWGDLKFERYMMIRYRLKGGKVGNRELKNREAKAALLDYLNAAGRLDRMQADTPLWVTHDFYRATRTSAPDDKQLTSHGFVKNLKRYAREAGLGAIHLHQTRHTASRVIGDKQGVKSVQEMLDHTSESVTAIYYNRLGTKPDRFSDALAEAFNIGDEGGE